MEKLIFTGENGDSLELFVLETTKLQEVEYLLASDVESGDGECYIFKDVSSPESEEAIYEAVTDEAELDYLVNVFAELMEDVDLEFNSEKKA